LPETAREGRPSFGVRATIGTVAVGIVLWGIVQPAYARRLWWSRPSTPVLVEQVMRAEPWLAEAVRWRIRNLLEQPSWRWEDAAEALALSGRAVRIHSGAAETWSVDALVNARIVREFGVWPDVVTAARRGYGMATRLEPHLPWYWLRWGQLERSLDHLDDAAALAQRSVTEEPNFVRGWLFLARVRFDMGLLDEARDARDRGLAAHQRAQGRRLTEYETNLLRLPQWQVEELAGVLD
jgi:tetratricopeptide (TPR) repeat protein